MLIRRASAADWPRIFPFWSAIVDDGESYAYPPGLDSAEAEAIWMSRPYVYVVEVDGRIVATAELAPVRPGRGAHIANAGFMVDPAAGGRGIGRALAEHVIGDARRLGFRGMQFNAVVETNTGAVALWRSLGFRIMTTIPEAFDSRRHGLVGLHVMYRSLAV